MEKLFYGHILSGGVKIHYYRTGDEKPPVVLVHGLFSSGLTYGSLSLALQPDYDVVMPDTRGHGLSDAPEDGYTVEDLVGDVATLIRELNLEKPVVVGHSIGAHTTAVLAVSHPELISGIVLEDPPWRVGSEAPLMAESDLRSQIDDYQKCTLEDLIREAEATYPEWDKGEQFQWAKARKQMRPNAAKLTAVVNESFASWREVAPKIKCPVLLCTGGPDTTAIVDAAVAAEASQTWKNSQVVHFPGAGHSIRRDRPKQFNQAVMRFISAIPRR